MPFDRVQGEEKPLTNLMIRESLGNKLQYFQLALAQRLKHFGIWTFECRLRQSRWLCNSSQELFYVTKQLGRNADGSARGATTSPPWTAAGHGRIVPAAAIRRIPPTVPCALTEPHPAQRMPELRAAGHNRRPDLPAIHLACCVVCAIPVLLDVGGVS